jgi:hypothetical protein
MNSYITFSLIINQLFSSSILCFISKVLGGLSVLLFTGSFDPLTSLSLILAVGIILITDGIFTEKQQNFDCFSLVLVGI